MNKLLYTITILTCTLAQNIYCMNGGAEQKKLAAQSKAKPVHIQVLEELAARPRTIEPEKPGESGTAIPAAIMQLINEYANIKYPYLLALMAQKRIQTLEPTDLICALTHGAFVIAHDNICTIFDAKTGTQTALNPLPINDDQAINTICALPNNSFAVAVDKIIYVFTINESNTRIISQYALINDFQVIALYATSDHKLAAIAGSPLTDSQSIVIFDLATRLQCNIFHLTEGLYTFAQTYPNRRAEKPILAVGSYLIDGRIEFFGERYYRSRELPNNIENFSFVILPNDIILLPIKNRLQAFNSNLANKDPQKLMPIEHCSLQVAHNQVTNLSLLCPQLLACACQDKKKQTVQVFDLETGETVFTAGHQQPISQVVGSENSFAYMCDKDLICYMGDEAAEKTLQTLLPEEHLALSRIISKLQQYAHGIPTLERVELAKSIAALPERLTAMKKNLHTHLDAIPLATTKQSTACVVQ